MVLKNCTKCNIAKDAEEDFGMTTSHGKRCRRAICKACQARGQQRYRSESVGYSRAQVARNYGYKERNRLWLEAQKDHPCSDCHQRFISCVMEFDHIRGEKLFELSRLAQTTRNLQALIDEAAKCELVCANCHRVRTFNRNQYNSKRVAHAG